MQEILLKAINCYSNYVCDIYWLAAMEIPLCKTNIIKNILTVWIYHAKWYWQAAPSINSVLLFWAKDIIKKISPQKRIIGKTSIRENNFLSLCGGSTVTDIPEKKWDFLVFAIFGPGFFFEKGDFLVQKPGFLNKNPVFFSQKRDFGQKPGFLKTGISVTLVSNAPQRPRKNILSF